MKEIILFNLLYISKNIKIKLFTKKGWVLMFKRVNQKTKPKEMKKTYNAKPSKYILIMGSLLLVYLFFFLKDMMLYEKIPPIDEGRIVITATLGTSFLLIFISTLLVLLSNSNKTIVLSAFSTTFRAKEIDLPSYMAETSTLFMKLLCKKTKMKIIGEFLASFRNTSYLCNVKCMFDYPGKFPERARLYRHYPF